MTVQHRMDPISNAGRLRYGVLKVNNATMEKELNLLFRF
jgi:hypothetical protein